VNVGHPEGQDDLEKVLSATMREVFGTVARDPSEDTNTQVIGTNGQLSGQRLRRSLASMPVDLRLVAALAAGRLEPALEGGEVYTDDKAPVEWLVDKSIVDYAADGE
jgi:hypothetical protein